MCGVVEVQFGSISAERKGADKEQKGLLVLLSLLAATEIEQRQDEQLCGGRDICALCNNNVINRRVRKVNEH